MRDYVSKKIKPVLLAGGNPQIAKADGDIADRSWSSVNANQQMVGELARNRSFLGKSQH